MVLLQAGPGGFTRAQRGVAIFAVVAVMIPAPVPGFIGGALRRWRFAGRRPRGTVE